MSKKHKSKKCKVEYVDNVNVSFDIECAEIKASKYRIYAKPLNGEYKLIKTKNDKQKAIDFANNLDDKMYDGKLIIEHNYETDSDFPVDIER